MTQQMAETLNGIIKEAYSIAQDQRKPGALNGDWMNNPIKKREDALFEQLDKLDKEIGKGLKVGKYIKFQVADGYAHYLITRLNRETVEVIHLPLGDGYKFGGIGVDKKGNQVIFRTVAEANVRMNDFWKEKFGDNSM